MGFTPVGSNNEIKFEVKYEKLLNFCFCCGILGHTTERFCSLPKELRKPNYSSDMQAPPQWRAVEGPVQRFLDFGGTSKGAEVMNKAKLSEKIISAVAEAVGSLFVAAASVLPPAGGMHKALAMGSQEGGLALMHYRSASCRVLAGQENQDK